MQIYRLSLLLRRENDIQDVRIIEHSVSKIIQKKLQFVIINSMILPNKKRKNILLFHRNLRYLQHDRNKSENKVHICIDPDRAFYSSEHLGRIGGY